MRQVFFAISTGSIVAVSALSLLWPAALWSFAGILPLTALGTYDVCQRRRAVLRNFPVIGHFRYLLEAIRPEINQYFIESDTDGRPFSRNLRSVAYQRAKKTRDTRPFGTQRNVYEPGYEWLGHSMGARRPLPEPPRILIGETRCAQPYAASLLNISAMSFGSLSKNAILALNGGAKIGGFYHNTGEGGISSYHLQGGGDLVWQIGTGYFGCRAEDGGFDADRFRETAQLEAVKMIEVKISQGAKPGHGGILPAVKLTAEIATIRGVPLGSDVLSPPAHSAFATPKELLSFLGLLRELSGGKPVGFKFCVGHRSEFLGICKAMRETGQSPDFIVVDGGEGGTGAAPLEFADSIGTPLTDGLVFVHNALTGFGLRDQVKLIASGGLITGFHLAQRLALGADMCSSARGFMFALGCIQALRCNSNDCPVGVATQNPELVRGLFVTDKTQRVKNFHSGTVHAFLETLGAAGLEHPDELQPWHIHRRITPSEVKNYAEVFEYLEVGALLEAEPPPHWKRSLEFASADSFQTAGSEDGTVAVEPVDSEPVAAT